LYDFVTRIKDPTPYIVIEKQKVIDQLTIFQKYFGAPSVYYAVKANADVALVDLLKKHNCNFEVSSNGELAIMKHLKVPASRMISASSIKAPGFIKAAHEAGINYFTADSEAEIVSIAKNAPGSEVSIRLDVSNEGSEWPLSRKFGVTIDEGLQLLDSVKKTGLLPWGLSFHVGSQCTRLRTWYEAIDDAQKFISLAAKKGIFLNSVNLGGGFPIQYTKPIINLEELSQGILDYIKKTLPDIKQIVIEPGRGLVGHAGTIVSSLIAKAVRDGQRWLYLDIGVFNGLMEAIGGIKYEFVTDNKGAASPCIVAGPSCDSFDVIDKEVKLPELELGELVYILGAGAYTNAYASTFGGHPLPKVILI
jgi:ornithine decarboxylase